MNAIRATELVDLVYSKCYEFTEGGHNGTLTKFEAAEIVDALYEEFDKDEPEVEEEQEKKYVWVVILPMKAGHDCISLWESEERAKQQQSEVASETLLKRYPLYPDSH